MKSNLNFSMLLALTFFVTDSFSQLSTIESRDSLNQIQLQQFRKTFWDSLPKPIGWVNDFEALYSDSEENTLDSIINLFKNQTDIEVCVVTIDTNFISKEKFDSLTLHISNIWGVGDKRKDNGILIGISRGYRIMRIENGYGIEKIISDNETKSIIDNDFIPYFKQGNYYLGTENGLLKLIEVLRKKTMSNKKQKLRDGE